MIDPYPPTPEQLAEMFKERAAMIESMKRAHLMLTQLTDENTPTPKNLADGITLLLAVQAVTADLERWTCTCHTTNGDIGCPTHDPAKNTPTA